MWAVVHSGECIQECLAELRLRHDYKEDCEYYEGIDFLRKVLILSCAWVGEANSVSRAVCASLVSLMFSFIHIRLWPYRRSETNMLKAVCDYTQFFVFFLCSLQAANPYADDSSYLNIKHAVFFMWQIVVPVAVSGRLVHTVHQHPSNASLALSE